MRQLLKDSLAPGPAAVGDSVPSARMQRREEPEIQAGLVDRLAAKPHAANRAISLPQMPNGAAPLPPVNSSSSPVRSRHQLPPTMWMASQRRPPPLPTLYGKIRTQRQRAVAPCEPRSPPFGNARFPVVHAEPN